MTMTKKDYNLIGSAVYNEAIKHDAVRDVLADSGVALICEIENAKKSRIVVVPRMTQINSNAIKEWGFDPAETTVTVEYIIRGKTKQGKPMNKRVW